MRKENEAMIFRGGKQKRKRLRGVKMKNRCAKENEKYGMQKVNSDVKKRQETGKKKKITVRRDKLQKGRKMMQKIKKHRMEK